MDSFTWHYGSQKSCLQGEKEEPVPFLLQQLGNPVLKNKNLKIKICPSFQKKVVADVFFKDCGSVHHQSVILQDHVARETLDTARLQTQGRFNGLKLLDVSAVKLFLVGPTYYWALCFPGTSGQPHPSQFCEPWEPQNSILSKGEQSRRAMIIILGRGSFRSLPVFIKA